jgi:hypothetical protein
LRADEIVLSGAFGTMVPISPGDAFEASIAGLGSVVARFAEAGCAFGMNDRLCKAAVHMPIDTLAADAIVRTSRPG